MHDLQMKGELQKTCREVLQKVSVPPSAWVRERKQPCPLQAPHQNSLSGQQDDVPGSPPFRAQEPLLPEAPLTPSPYASS